MTNGQHRNGNDDEGTFENHEKDLIVRNGAAEATLKLGNAKNGSNEDGDC